MRATLGRYVAVHLRVEKDWVQYCGYRAQHLRRMYGRSMECLVAADDVIRRVITGLNTTTLRLAGIRSVYVATGLSDSDDAVRQRVRRQLADAGLEAVFREDVLPATAVRADSADPGPTMTDGAAVSTRETTTNAALADSPRECHVHRLLCLCCRGAVSEIPSQLPVCLFDLSRRIAMTWGVLSLSFW